MVLQVSLLLLMASFPHPLPVGKGWGTRMPPTVMRMAFTCLVITAMASPVMAQTDASRHAHKVLRSTLASQQLDFTMYPSEHFVLATDADKTIANSTLHELEATYQHIQRWADSLELSIDTAHEAWPVIYFMHQLDYERNSYHVGTAATQEFGFYLPSQHLAIFLDITNHTQMRNADERIAQLQASIRTLAELSTDDNEAQRRKMREQLDALLTNKSHIHQRFQQLVVRHEAAHMILNGLGILNPNTTNPDWLTEGIACLFETQSPNNDRPNSNPMRLADLQRALSQPPDSVPHQRQAIVPLATFVDETTFSTRSTHETAWRYAQAWALVQYMQANHPTLFTSFLTCQARTTILPKSQKVSPCFKTTFLTNDSQFESQWDNWLSSLKLDHAQGRR